MASSKSQVTLIDTCGLIFSLSGLRLKMLKMKSIKPELVLGIGYDEEFEVLKSFMETSSDFTPLPRLLERL